MAEESKLLNSMDQKEPNDSNSIDKNDDVDSFEEDKNAFNSDTESNGSEDGDHV